MLHLRYVNDFPALVLIDLGLYDHRCEEKPRTHLCTCRTTAFCITFNGRNYAVDTMHYRQNHSVCYRFPSLTLDRWERTNSQGIYSGRE